MGRRDGPHTRHPQPGSLHRGSKKRIRRLSAFASLPLDFWIVIAVAAAMLGLSVAIIWAAAN